MSYGIKAVTKNRPCPICGKPDWCGFMPQDEGGEMVLCMRDVDHENVIGLDGNFYIYVSQSRSDNSIFEEAVQRQTRQEKWAAEKGYKQKAHTQPREYKKASESTIAKKQLIVEDEVSPKSHIELDKIYRYLLELLALDEVHKQYLMDEAWSEELIERNMIRSLPERDFTRFKYKNFFSKNKYRKTLASEIIKKYGPDCLVGVPGAYIDKNGNWTFEGPKGIVFPIYDARGYIYRLRIRMDYMDTNHELTKGTNGVYFYEDSFGKHYLQPMKGFYTCEDGAKVFEKVHGKYRNMSSYRDDEDALKQGIKRNTYTKGCESGNQIGVYCNPGRDNMYICFVTEGEKKGIFCNDKLRAPFVSIPGVNSWFKLFEGEKGERMIDHLKEKGVHMFIVAYDADKETNEKVLNCEKGLVEALKEEGVGVGVGNWNQSLGKGLDDYLKLGYQPEYTLIC